MKQQEEVNRLQDILLLIRKSMGWSAEDFADKIGVTRQTINNLECKPPRSELTKTQYIAMRTVFDREIDANPEGTHMLNDLLNYCVDHYEEVSEESRQVIVNKAKMLAPAVISKEITREEAGKEWKEILKMAGIFAAGVLVGASLNTKFDWYSKISKPVEKTIKKALK